MLVTVDGTSLAKLKAASYGDSRSAVSCASNMRHPWQATAGPHTCLNSTPVCRYKEKASFESKWVRIDKRRQNWNILFLVRPRKFIIVNYFCFGYSPHYRRLIWRTRASIFVGKYVFTNDKCVQMRKYIRNVAYFIGIIQPSFKILTKNNFKSFHF